MGIFDNVNNTQPTGIINMQKGGVLDLAKAAPALKKVIVGAGWDMVAYGADADLDLTAILEPTGGRVNPANVNNHIVYYNNQEVRGVRSTGDNRTGAGDGDDEQIIVDLEQVDPSISNIHFVVTIHEAEARKQTFGMVNNAFVRLVDAETDKEILHYQLTGDYATSTAIEFCKLNRTPAGWQFEAVGNGSNANIEGLLLKHITLTN